MRLRRPANPLRSTPLRLTLTLIAIFAVSSLATFGFAYLSVRQTFDDALHESIRQMLASFHSVDEPKELRERVAAEVAVTPPETAILRYVPDAGAPIGNVDGLPAIDAFRTVSEGEVAAGASELSDS